MTIERPQSKDAWVAGELYEAYVGRWSRLVAREFLRWLAMPSGSDWLDVGCGTGVLTEVILENESPKSVKSVDPSADFITYARSNVTDARASFEVGDAQRLPIETASVDAAVAGLSLNFVPKPSRTVAEISRVVRPGGEIAAYVWDYAGRMELMRHFWDVAVVLEPAAYDFDEARRFPICRPMPLTELFAEAGLRDVEVRPIDIPTHFRDFDDYWAPFLGGQGPAPGFTMSLDETRRDAVKNRIRSQLPIAEDGTIHLIARAWAIRGRTP